MPSNTTHNPSDTAAPGGRSTTLLSENHPLIGDLEKCIINQKANERGIKAVYEKWQELVKKLHRIEKHVVTVGVAELPATCDRWAEVRDSNACAEFEETLEQIERQRRTMEYCWKKAEKEWKYYKFILKKMRNVRGLSDDEIRAEEEAVKERLEERVAKRQSRKEWRREWP